MNKYFSAFLSAFIITATFLTLLNFSSCDETPVDPYDQLKPGRRDYVWTIDTLGIDYDIYYRIWGSSPTDVWVTGPNSSPPNNILHFNGEKWEAVGPLNLFFPARGISGFTSKDIWAGGDNGDLWHYNGTDWQKEIEITKGGSNQIGFDNMWSNNENIFAFGAYPDENGGYNNPIIVQLINNEWTFLNTDNIVGIIHQLYKDNKGRIFIQNLKWWDYVSPNNSGDSTQIYEYSNGKFEQLYSSLWYIGQTSDVSLINGEAYFVLGNKIAKRNDNKFQTVFTIDHPNFYGHIWGRSEKDIFMEMIDGIGHYNGSNIEFVHDFNTTRARVYDAILFEDEVFFLAHSSEKNQSLLYHGKLVEGG